MKTVAAWVTLALVLGLASACAWARDRHAGHGTGGRAVGERFDAGLAGGQLATGRSGRFLGGHVVMPPGRRVDRGVAAGVLVAAPVVVYAAPPPPPYWYYCASAGAYYPFVQLCPEGWQAVIPQSPAPY
jgi:hypothetical protein